MAWRLAKSLSVLRTEILARYPGTTVWTIGDQAHASGYSDHNPNGADVVCAIDVKADGGMSLQAFVDHLVAHPHSNLRYVIYNRRICQRSNGWVWKPYYGVNAHRDHVHVSVGNGPDGRSTTSYDSTSPWGIATMGKPPAPSTGLVPDPPLRENDTGPRVGHLQRALNAALGLKLAVDEDFGPSTTGGVKLLQRTAGITEDGIYGSDSAAALRDLLEDDMSWDEEIPLITGQGVAYSGTKWPARFLAASNHYYTLLYGQKIAAEQAAAKKRDEAILAKLAGADTKSIIDAINARAAEDAGRDAALMAEAAASVRAALDPAALAAAIAEGLDDELDLETAERAVETALRRVFGELDRADE